MYQHGHIKLTTLPVLCYAVVFAIMITCSSFIASAHANASTKMTEVEKFVQEMADHAIEQLTDKDADLKKREKIMRKILDTSFSVNTIARFSLGQFWRSANEAQQEEYLDLFEDMIVTTYADRFKEYAGQKLQVTGFSTVNKYDTIVHSQIIEKGASTSKDNIRVDWRVRSRKGKTLIIDIIVEGISMSITQRSDFESVIQKGGGDIEALLKSMREQTDKSRKS